MGIFDRLGYSFTDNTGVVDLSDTVKSHMNTVPTLLETWQTDDVGNNEVDNYFRNPVANVVQQIRNTCNTLHILIESDPSTNTEIITGSSSLINSLFVTMNTETINIGTNNGGLFIGHTNRISGVTPLADDANTALLPHYETAMGIGQLVMYLTYQSDSIQNNSPIMGNFTSILIEEKLNSLNVNISSYFTTINNSITITGSGTIIDPFVRTSNLSLGQVQTISNNISEINTTLYVRRTHDENFFANSKQVATQFKSIKKFSNLGATANNLLQNYIGTDKLLSRINS
jgi:hypothetical protein